MRLIQTLTTGKPARYSVDGRRVSKERYYHLMEQAHIYGNVYSMATAAWPVERGGTKRKNYTTIGVEKS